MLSDVVSLSLCYNQFETVFIGFRQLDYISFTALFERRVLPNNMFNDHMMINHPIGLFDISISRQAQRSYC